MSYAHKTVKSKRSRKRKRKMDPAPSYTNKKRRVKIEVYCICRKPDDGSAMFQCFDCKEWFHYQCFQLDPECPVYSDKWECPVCPNGESGDHSKNHNNNNNKCKQEKKEIDIAIHEESEGIDLILCDSMDIDADDKQLDSPLLKQLIAFRDSLDEEDDIKTNDTFTALEVDMLKQKIIELKMELKQKADNQENIANLNWENNDKWLKLIEQKDETIKTQRDALQQKDETISELQKANDALTQQIESQSLNEIDVDEDTQNSENTFNSDKMQIVEKNHRAHSPTDWWQCSHCGFENEPPIQSLNRNACAACESQRM